MIRSTARKSVESARQILDRIQLSRQVGRQDYFLLTSMILADTSLTYAERQQINRLFDEVQTGQIQMVD